MSDGIDDAMRGVAMVGPPSSSGGMVYGARLVDAEEIDIADEGTSKLEDGAIELV